MFRHLISGKVRSNNGCYTCRLRRKKCDEARPVCAGCETLEITCYSGDDKPDWMDGGPKQKEMAERIKAQVKKQASQRRDRKYLEMLENGTKMVTLGADEPPTHNETRRQDVHVFGGSDTEPPVGIESVLTPPSSNTSGNSPPEIPWHTQNFFRQATQSTDSPDIDLHFIMIYLDYVFPYLFPQYRPSILVGGRGWVLDVVQSNKAVYHTVISLASYFFSIILAGGQEEHVECVRKVENRLEEQMEMSLRALQKEMRAITAQHAVTDPREGLLAMQSIIQMLIFVVTTSNKENWKMHLDAAIALFMQILPRPEHWSEVLANLFSDRFPPATMTDGFRRPWSTHQAALRFFSAILFHIDIMSSLTLGAAPRLYRFQASIIPGCQEQEITTTFQSSRPLAMEEFTGLYNWVMQMVGDVASLHSWKKVQAKAGTLSMQELMSRGKILEEALTSAAAASEVQLQMFEQQGIHVRISHIVDDTLSQLNGAAATKTPAAVSQNWIWLQATLIHLRLVLYGWQPYEPTTRAMVVKLTDTLCNLPSPACLRTAAWPFCLAGCLALPEDECKFRQLADGLGVLRVFVTVLAFTVWAPYKAGKTASEDPVPVPRPKLCSTKAVCASTKCARCHTGGTECIRLRHRARRAYVALTGALSRYWAAVDRCNAQVDATGEDEDPPPEPAPFGQWVDIADAQLAARRTLKKLRKSDKESKSVRDAVAAAADSALSKAEMARITQHCALTITRALADLAQSQRVLAEAAVVTLRHTHNVSASEVPKLGPRIFKEFPAELATLEEEMGIDEELDEDSL